MNIYWIDLFSGAGGTTTGIHLAGIENVKVVACVNHDEKAIESHKANHPDCLHLVEDVRDMKVIRALKNLVTNLRADDPTCLINIWASLECTNYSKAKGGLPRDADSRTLAYVLYDYIEALNPAYLYIENVREFMAWGPLDQDGKPISLLNGIEYLDWRKQICDFGYRYDSKLINAADHGAYTSRERYFAQFAQKGMPIKWPEQTHSKIPVKDGLFEGLKKWKPVKDVLDFSDKGKSIFERKKPLSENTLKRIYAGLVKYVANGETTFLKKYYSGRPMGKVISVNGPAGAITTIDGHALVQPEFLIQYNGNSDVRSSNEPAGTITTKDRFAVTWIDKQTSWLLNPQFNSKGGSVNDPCFTLIARMDKKPPYLVQIEGTGDVAIAIYPEDSETMVKIKHFMAAYGITNIYMRMLKIEELKLIQGFPKNYILIGTQTDQKKFLGNAVHTAVSKALAIANYEVNQGRYAIAK